MPELPSPKWEIELSRSGQTAFAGDGAELRGPFVVFPKN
jgi:hypothetical protein